MNTIQNVSPKQEKSWGLSKMLKNHEKWAKNERVEILEKPLSRKFLHIWNTTFFSEIADWSYMG